MRNMNTRTNTEAGANREGMLVTMAIKPRVKRGIVINLPSPEGVVSFTMTDHNGEWCGEGKMKVEHYSEEALQFLWGFLEFACGDGPTSPAASGEDRLSSRHGRSG